MASLWNALREEVRGTVDDFRQKGALGALRDAALDAKDLVTSAGSALVDGVQGLVVGEGEEDSTDAVLRSATVPVRGATAPLEFRDGRVLDAVVVDVDGVSEPPRARVTAEGIEAPMLVTILAPGVPIPPPAEKEGGLLQGIKDEWDATVQDFREKGAVGAVRDAALDAVDIVGSTAQGAVSGAKELAGDLIGLGDSAPEASAATAAASTSAAASPDAPKAAGVASSGAARETEASSAAAGSPNAAGTGIIDGLKQELHATVKDLREKGAVGALKDAALDAADIVGSTASTVADGAKSLAKPLIDLDDKDSRAATIVGGIKDELHATVQDLREKGAVSTAKEAALDAVDLLGNTATAVAGGAKTLAAPLLGWSPSDAAQDGGASQEGSSAAAAVGGSAAASEATAPAAQPAPAASGAQASAPLGAGSAGAGAAGAFAPPARKEAAPEAAPVAAAATAAAPAAEAGPPAEPPLATTPKAHTPTNAAATPPLAEDKDGKPARKSLVQMRRGMFEKPKEQAKQDDEALLD